MIPSSEFYFVSDMSHGLCGCLFILGPIALGFIHPWYAAAFITVVSGIKEAFIDPRTETPAIAGSGLRDWLGYCVGALVGLGLLCIFKKAFL